jgi:hypothetical protein
LGADISSPAPHYRGLSKLTPVSQSFRLRSSEVTIQILALAGVSCLGLAHDAYTFKEQFTDIKVQVEDF